MAFVNSDCLHRVTGVVLSHSSIIIIMDININLTNSINLSMFSVHMGIHVCCDDRMYTSSAIYISNEL